MSDDIKIRVGVQSDVKSGMSKIVKDIRGQSEEMGRGFGAAFRQAAQGNVQGAINALFGGAVAGAGIAGWQAGKALDEMFGISDKVSAAWNRAAESSGRAWDAFYKGLRANRVAAEKDLTEEKETPAQLFAKFEYSTSKPPATSFNIPSLNTPYN